MTLTGLSREINVKNFDKNLQNLVLLRDAAGFGWAPDFIMQKLFIAVNVSLRWLKNGNGKLLIFGRTPITSGV
jgi:hypothetical protein